jgi:hypothetical protein
MTILLLKMHILGRQVEAVQYGNGSFVTASVKQSKDDCRRNLEPYYQCMDNCDGNLVTVRFLEKKTFSIRALMVDGVGINADHKEISWVCSVDDLEKLAQQDGYKLVDEDNIKHLYYQGQSVAFYSPCSSGRDYSWFSEDTRLTINELEARVDEVYQIAEKKPLEDMIKDPIMARCLLNPYFASLIAEIVGPEAAELATRLRNLKIQTN